MKLNEQSTVPTRRQSTSLCYGTTSNRRTQYAYNNNNNDSRYNNNKCTSSTRLVLLNRSESAIQRNAMNRIPKWTSCRDVVQTSFSGTILSLLILERKYQCAIKRVKKYANEASTWIFLSCNSLNHISNEQQQQQQQYLLGDDIRARPYLPIHLACCNKTNFDHETDSSTIQLLNELIALLIIAYPDGAHKSDHRNIYPIQDAVRYGAAPETIAMFLITMPSLLNIVDCNGQSLQQIHSLRLGGTTRTNDPIQRLLDHDIKYWIRKNEDVTAKGLFQIGLHNSPSNEQVEDKKSVVNIEMQQLEQIKQRAIANEYKLQEMIADVSRKQMILDRKLSKLDSLEAAVLNGTYAHCVTGNNKYDDEGCSTGDTIEDTKVTNQLQFRAVSSLVHDLDDSPTSPEHYYTKKSRSYKKQQQVYHDDTDTTSECSSFSNDSTISEITNGTARFDVSIEKIKVHHCNEGMVDVLPDNWNDNDYDTTPPIMITQFAAIRRYQERRLSKIMTTNCIQQQHHLYDDDVIKNDLSDIYHWAEQMYYYESKKRASLDDDAETIATDYSPIHPLRYYYAK